MELQYFINCKTIIYKIQISLKNKLFELLISQYQNTFNKLLDFLIYKGYSQITKPAVSSKP